MGAHMSSKMNHLTMMNKEHDGKISLKLSDEIFLIICDWNQIWRDAW